MKTWGSCRASIISAALLLLVGCGDLAAPAATQQSATPGAAGATAASAETCAPTGAHGGHARVNLSCSVCHPCGGVLGLGDLTYPRGTSTNGGTIVPGTATEPARCAVACHYPLGAPAHEITWDTPGPLACTSCHAVSTLPSIHPTIANPDPTRADCEACHDMSQHTSGVVVAGHAATWMATDDPGFHAFAANRGLATCQTCHGEDLSGGPAGIGCAACHDGAQAPAWNTCTMCHGGANDLTGAPPKATWANRGDPVKIGAHSSHVGVNPVSSPMGCEECHPVPGDVFAPGHVDGAVQVRFEGPLSGLGAATWNYPTTPTCTATYCHGNFTRGNTANAPDWTGVNQAACGTCHPARPFNYLHNRHQRNYTYSGIPWWPPPGASGWVTCDQCHFGIASSTSSTSPTALSVVGGAGPPLHVNGTTDVVFQLGGTYTKGPYDGTCSNMSCHPGETKGWPR